MSSPDVWPEGAIAPGSHVRVIRDANWNGPWAQEFIGIVDGALIPRRVVNAHAKPGELSYLIAFAESQFDSSGDGPYRKAVIWARYLVPLE